jgi:hypothetical protein
LVFLLPVKFGGLIIMPDRPETFVDWWLGRWPAEIAIAGVLLWVALALFCRRRRKEAESRADVHPPFQEPDPASDGKAAEDCRTPRRGRANLGSRSQCASKIGAGCLPDGWRRSDEAPLQQVKFPASELRRSGLFIAAQATANDSSVGAT